MADDSKTIFRVHREERNRFSVLDNGAIRDPRLSFKATGILCYLLSLPDDWQASQMHLSTVKPDGRDAIISGFRELQEAGYVVKNLVRENGRIVTTEWHIYERPVNAPKSGFPTSEIPMSGLPTSENPTLRKTEGNERLTETNTAADAVSVSLAFGQFWLAYPRKEDKKKAETAFKKHHCFDKIEVILAALELHKKKDQWQRGIIPHPTTWLNGHRWEDDLSHEKTRANHSTNSAGSAQGRGGEANAKRADQYAGLGNLH